jgi:hypothetical protein
MIAIGLFLLVLVLVDLGALRWGVSSTDDISSCEWDRRRENGYRVL